MDRKKLSKVVAIEEASKQSFAFGNNAPLASQGRRVIQNFLLIWLDTKLNNHNPDFQRSIKALRRTVSSINTFTDAQTCMYFLSEVKKERVFMIVSGYLGKLVVPTIESWPQIECIYIFCGNKAKNEHWAKKIQKVKGVFTEIDPICEALAIDRRACDRNMVSISFNHISPQFMYTQLLKDAIMQIKDEGDEEIKTLVRFCQEQDDIDPDQISQVRTKYRHHTPIWWYTANTYVFTTQLWTSRDEHGYYFEYAILYSPPASTYRTVI